MKRGWWAHRSGLLAPLSGDPAAVLSQCGWARSVGGVSPYLALFARAGLRRNAVDAALAACKILELPSARGCTYVLPASDYSVGLGAGASAQEAALRPAFSLGVSREEVENLATKVRAVLKEPLEPDAIRVATKDASRSLGEAGKKKGISTTLPLALGLLQARGEIRRVPLNGRLDQQRYAYVAWEQLVEAAPFERLARCFFRWHGPAKIADFQWFSGLGVAASKAAVAGLGLVQVEQERWLLPENIAEYRAFSEPASPVIRLVGSLDPLIANRRDLASLLDPEDAKQPVWSEKGMSNAGSLADLSSHAILDRGRLVGLWDYDPAEKRIVWKLFGEKREEVQAAVAEMEAFIEEDLGDARTFSLDSPSSRTPRLAALRR